MLVAFGLQGNFTTQEPVDDDEIHNGEGGAEGPPDEADTKGVRAGNGGGDRLCVEARPEL